MEQAIKSLTVDQEYKEVKMDPNRPVVNVGSRQNPSYLPMEVCEVIPGQQVKKKLTPSEVQKMVDFACRRPKLNADSIANDGKAILGLNTPDNAGLVGDIEEILEIIPLTFLTD